MSANEPLSSDDIPMDWEVEDSSSSESSGAFQGLIQAVLAATKAAIKNRRWSRAWKRKRHIEKRTLRHPDNTGVRKLRDNPYESEWWRILENESIVDPDTNAGKEFRRDFRVPFKVFDFIYQEAKEATKENGSLMWPSEDALGQPTHPLSLKILAALHILGHGTSFRSVEGRTGIDEDTIREFFHNLTDWMVQRFYAEFCRALVDHYTAFLARR
jgi:hypothetical protein